MMPKQLAKRLLQNSSVRNAVRMCLYFPVDVYETVTRQKPALVPPRGMRYNNTRAYLDVAKVGLAQVIHTCGLKPHHNILDVGCGSGSVAVPLLGYLKQGTYDGFDIVPSWISWCQKNITATNPNFRFKFVDVHSKHYNSSGKITSESLRFPYADRSFDCVMLFSIFTHMRLVGIANYISEIARVLKPGGHGFITSFLLNDESRKAIAEGRSSLPFPYSFEGCLILDDTFPETAIATPERQILEWLGHAGLRVKDIRRGSWAGRSGQPNLHDDLVIEKSPEI